MPVCLYFGYICRKRGDLLDFVKNFTHVPKIFGCIFFLDTSGWSLIDLTWVLGAVRGGGFE